MNNSVFDIIIDKAEGFVNSIKNCFDQHQMNWCAKDGSWGRIIGKDYYFGYADSDGSDMKMSGDDFSLIDLTTENNRCEAVYSNKKIVVKVIREFTENGNLAESYIIKNITDTVMCVNRDTFGIELPFNDRYTNADECMVRHCNTHIWCGHNVAWVNALKMGESDYNLGLFLTDGAIDCYSQDGCKTNVRGNFILHPESKMLKSGEEYLIRWELFWHKATEDFYNTISKYTNYIGIEAEHYTVFKNEKIRFCFNALQNKKPEVFCNGKQVDFTDENGICKVEYTPESVGEYRFKVKCGEVSTWADFIVKGNFKELLEKRVRFIVRNQQCLDEKSPLYGAFLIYDNETESQYFNDFFHDHNACRERVAMPFLLLKYLQMKEDKEIRAALDLYINFVFREFYDEQTGEVFNSIGKKRNLIRPYNAPGVMLLLTEMYFATNETRYLRNILKLAERYYSIGGEKCYSNGVAVEKVMRAFYEAGLSNEAEKMLDFFKIHAENIINNGTSYPKHEVNYEQTIVTPAVSIISEVGLCCENNERYVREAEKHIKCLERFCGTQPSFHLNQISIRFWDDYWFGKSGMFGDTLPHHLSCLTARAYYNYSRLSGEKHWLLKAEECIRNCLCLISDDGRGSAAYVYPYTANGMRAQFYDSWANDQDLIFYDALYLSDCMAAFAID